MDPAELRRKNYLAGADLPYEIDLPYRDGNPLVYDSGDFRAGLEAALGAVDYDGAAPGASRAARAGHSPRHRPVGLRRGHGHRAVRGRDGPDGRLRPRGGGDGRGEPGAGAGDLVRPGGGRRARDSDRVGDGDRWRHRGHPVRHRDVREPERGERGQLHSRRIGPRAGQARGRGGGAPGGGPRRRRDRRRHGLGARDAGLRGAARPGDPGLAAHLRPRGSGVAPTSRRRSIITSRR